MDINRLFKVGMSTCGRVMRVLPKDEIGTPKQYMMYVLKEFTMPSIDELYPRLQRIQLNTSMLIEVPNTTNKQYVGYRIPLEVTQGLEIMGVRNLYTGMGNSTVGGNPVGYMTGSSWMSSHPNRFGRFSSANLYESVVRANIAYADMQLLGQVQEAPIPRFEPPNIIWINAAYQSSSSFYVVLCLKNDDNLISIPDSAYEGIKRLFILDLKSTIYNEYGILSNVDTTLGSLDLKIDDWSGCASERNDLYDQYHSMAHLRKHSMISG